MHLPSARRRIAIFCLLLIAALGLSGVAAAQRGTYGTVSGSGGTYIPGGGSGTCITGRRGGPGCG